MSQGPRVIRRRDAQEDLERRLRAAGTRAGRDVQRPGEEVLDLEARLAADVAAFARFEVCERCHSLARDVLTALHAVAMVAAAFEYEVHLITGHGLLASAAQAWIVSGGRRGTAKGPT